MFVPKCFEGLVPSEAQQQEAIQTNGVRLEVPKRNGNDNGVETCHNHTNTEAVSVVVHHQKGVSTEIM